MPLSPPECHFASTGLFVAFEGGDGAGKSTQAELLREHLEREEVDVVRTFEPGGTEVGQSIRTALLYGGEVAPRAEALLFAADRAQHVHTVVGPALARGAVVLTDRYLDSSVAYQGVARDQCADDIMALSLWATGGLLPHLTVLLDIEAQMGRARRGAEHDRLEAEADDFHDATRRGFLELADRAPERYLVLPAARSAEALAEQVWRRVAPMLSTLGEPRDQTAQQPPGSRS